MDEFVMSCKTVLTKQAVEKIWFKYGFLLSRDDATKVWSPQEK